MIDLETEFVHLVRLAMAGKQEDVLMLARKHMRVLMRNRPDLSEEIKGILARSPQKSPTRMLAPQPIPVDVESKLELLRCDMVVDLKEDPVWPSRIQEELDSVVEERKRESELVAEGLHPLRSLLLTGPPGVGKTLAARWIANKLNRPLLTLDLASVMSSYLGRTGNNIRAVLEYAKRVPSVLLLDEFDAIAKRRDDVGEVGELKRLVTVLLQEVDEWPSSGVLVAATNHPDLLDPAVWRRFERVIEFPKPSCEEIEQLLDRQVGKEVGVALRTSFSILLEGKSFAEVVRHVELARRTAILEKRPLAQAMVKTILKCGVLQEKRQRMVLAEVMLQEGYSQREMSQLTGLSRDTLRKRLGPLLQK